MLRKVRATIRLAPQLKTVAIEMALPRIWAGNISLRSNHDTENVSLYFGRGSARSCCRTLCTKSCQWLQNGVKIVSFLQLRLIYTNRKRLWYRHWEWENLQFDQSHSESVSRFWKNFPSTRQLTTLLYIEPHREETSKLTHKIEKSQSNDKVCAPIEDGGDGDGATTNVRRIELTEHQPCHYNTE